MNEYSFDIWIYPVRSVCLPNENEYCYDSKTIKAKSEKEAEKKQKNMLRINFILVLMLEL